MGAMPPIHLMAAFAVTSFVGAVMILQGMKVHLLDRRPARCRSCGGGVDRTCTCRRRD